MPNATTTNADRPQSNSHRCKKPGHYRNQCRLLKRQKELFENTQNLPGSKNSAAKKSIPNNNTNQNDNNNYYKNSKRAERKQKTVDPSCETCGKTNHSTQKCYYGANVTNRPPLRHKRPKRQNQVQKRAKQNDSNESTQAAAQNLNQKCHVFTPELRLTDRRLPNFQQPLSCLAATAGDLFN